MTRTVVTIRIAPAPRPSVLVEVADEEGRIGHGEVAPLPPFSREGADGCQRALARCAVLGPIDEALSAAEAIARSFELEPISAALAEAPGARFALETALVDLLAQRRGISVAALLGGGSYAEVPVNALLFAPPVETLADRALALAAKGFSAIKIKLRAADEAGFSRELAALVEVRARLPLPFELRLDPNAAWAPGEARARLARLAAIAPRYVEQPVAAQDLPALGACAVPWAADESLVDPRLAERLLHAPGCAAFILKPALIGLLAARDLAIRAQARGIEVVITHLFDGPFAMAAAAELALSLPRPPLACGLAPHPDLPRFADNLGGAEIPQLAVPGLVRSSGGPGLGVRTPWRLDGRG